MSEDKKLYRDTSRKVEVKQGTEEAMNVSNSKFYH